MKSIQTQLIRWLVGVLLFCSLTIGGGLSLWLRHVVTEEFDHALVLRATTLQVLVTRQPDGRIDFEGDASSLRISKDHRPSEYIQFSDTKGRVLYHHGDPPLDASSAASRKARDIRLPDGRDGRVVTLAFQPQIEGEEGESHSPAHKDPADPLRITVARDRHSLDESLHEITLAVSLASIVISVIAIGASVLVVRQGLGTLHGLTAQVSRFDPGNPSCQFNDASLPSELVPIAQTLDELAQRVSTTIARERQFSVAVSHELRTPIAELLVITDVALRDPASRDRNVRALDEARDVGKEMQQMVATLLEIARLEHGSHRLPSSVVELDPLIEKAVCRHAETLRDRCVTVRRTIESPNVVANEDALRAVVNNLIGNAAHYASSGGAIEVSSRQTAGAVHLSIANEQNQLAGEDAARVFEPFWRKDSARAGSNVGLGLTLVRAYCDAMKASVSAVVDSRGWFVVTASFPV